MQSMSHLQPWVTRPYAGACHYLAAKKHCPGSFLLKPERLCEYMKMKWSTCCPFYLPLWAMQVFWRIHDEVEASSSL